MPSRLTGLVVGYHGRGDQRTGDHGAESDCRDGKQCFGRMAKWPGSWHFSNPGRCNELNLGFARTRCPHVSGTRPPPPQIWFQGGWFKTYNREVSVNPVRMTRHRPGNSPTLPRQQMDRHCVRRFPVLAIPRSFCRGFHGPAIELKNNVQVIEPAARCGMAISVSQNQFHCVFSYFRTANFRSPVLLRTSGMRC